MEHQRGASRVQAPALLANIRLGWKVPRPFQPSLLFVGKAKNITRVEHQKGRLLPYSQTLWLAEKAKAQVSRPFQPSLRFAGKARVSQSKVSFRCCTLGQAPDLTYLYQTKLEKLAKDKRSSLLEKFVYYGRKKFYNIETCCLHSQTTSQRSS